MDPHLDLLIYKEPVKNNKGINPYISLYTTWICLRNLEKIKEDLQIYPQGK